MDLRSRIILPVTLAAMFAGVARADVHKRWELTFDHDRPEHYTFRSPLGEARSFIYLTYTVTNKTAQACPLIVDVALLSDKRNYQQPGFYPVEENAIIANADGLKGYSVGIQKELIEDFKKRHKYMSKADIRAQKLNVLQPGESVHCLAIFEDKQFRYNDVEILVSGLVDPIAYKSAHEPGKSTSESNMYLRYENSVFRLTYGREGDEFRSYERGWTLKKKDWVVVGVNPAVTKEDLNGLVAALTNDDPLVRGVAKTLLMRYTGAARRDIDWDRLFSDNPNDKVDVLREAKALLSALGDMTNLQQRQPALFTSLKEQLTTRIPPIPDDVKTLTRGAELSSDQIKDLQEKVKVIVTKAKENKCPLPSNIEAALTRAEPTSELVYDWICGYKDPSTDILYHGIQQWEAYIDDVVMAKNQQGNFTFVESLFESLDAKTGDEHVRDIAIQVLKDIATDERMNFDVSAFDPKKPLADQDAKVKDAVLRWHEWWSRNRDTSYWNSTTKSFEPRPKK